MRQSNEKAPKPVAEGEEEKKVEDDADADAEAKSQAEEVAAEQDQICYGKRFIREQNIQYDFVFLCEDIKKVVAEPEWPDPDNEPLPPPLINSI